MKIAWEKELILLQCGSNARDLVLYAKWELNTSNMVAQIGETLYSTLAAALNAVPANTQTTIKLLKNINGNLTVPSNKNIIFDLQGNYMSNNGNDNIIKNSGTLILTNGTVRTSADTKGACDNESTGNITIDNVTILVTGGRQALYNNKGIATITGNSYLSSGATERAAVQNLAGGTLNIVSGTIISTGQNGIQNQGTMTIGTQDGNVIENSPIIQGAQYGIYTTTNMSFFDGTIKGKAGAIDNINKVTQKEEGYELIDDGEIIAGDEYKVKFLGVGKTITFDPNGGSVNPTTMKVAVGKKLTNPPVATRAGYNFDGWFTDKDEGDPLDLDEIITEDKKYFAHWTKVNIAKIGNTEYPTLQAAINAAPANTQTTIKLLLNATENVSIASNKNIIFDFSPYTLKNNGKAAVIENNGTLELISGTITSNAEYATVNNNNGGTITVSGGSIISTGTRQSIYNNSGGTVIITGTAYLRSTATGTPTTSTMERGTIQNLAGGTIVITGGRIEGVYQQALSNEGTITIGTKDGNVNTSTPVIIGKTIAVKNAETGTLNFYDGVLKGITNPFDGTITEEETGYEGSEGTEVIDNLVYKIYRLVISQ